MWKLSLTSCDQTLAAMGVDKSTNNKCSISSPQQHQGIMSSLIDGKKINNVELPTGAVS